MQKFGPVKRLEANPWVSSSTETGESRVETLFVFFDPFFPCSLVFVFNHEQPLQYLCSQYSTTTTPTRTRPHSRIHFEYYSLLCPVRTMFVECPTCTHTRETSLLYLVHFTLICEHTLLPALPLCTILPLAWPRPHTYFV